MVGAMRIQSAFVLVGQDQVAIIHVKPEITKDLMRARGAISKFRHFLPNWEVVLMSRDKGLHPNYIGPGEIVSKLKKTDEDNIPWGMYEIVPQ